MRKKKRRLSVFIMVILILTVGMAGIRTAEGYAAWQQDSAGIAQGIATEIIRFHVRANSDSEADQQLKLQVKDRVVTYMEPLLRESQDIEQSRQILEEQTENIRTLALDTLREAGSDYDVAVYFENSYFPMKSYGDVTFPPGEYEAFRIDIGAHDGKNWWCVLFPPLCLSAAGKTSKKDREDEFVEVGLTPDQYRVITESGTDTRYKVRFRFLELFESIFR